MKTYTIRPLKWTRLSFCECSIVPGGKYEIEGAGLARWRPDIGMPRPLERALTHRAAKLACNRHHRKRMKTMLKEVGGEK